MSSDFFEKFNSVWVWKRISQKALDELEISLRNRLDTESDSEAHDELMQLKTCREEFENFTVLSLWTVFEEFLNTWIAKRTQWVSTSTEYDETIRSSLLRRIEYWGIAEKINTLKPIIGSEHIKDLHRLRLWRNWIAHSKVGARPEAMDVEMIESLFRSIVIQLERLSHDESKALL